MRSLELSGVIGTWAAVALALIALIGVLPIYIGYRKRLSTWAKQIAKVDDPDQKFVAKGWPGLPGQRLFSRVHVPNLLDPPNIASIHIERKRFSEFWPRESQSHTGWVNFLNILRSYNIIELEGDADGKLDMVDGELVLFVHRSWILLLGIIDRYSKRGHHGLLSGQSREPQVELSFSNSALYGLSGVMSERLSIQDEEQRYGLDVICFHMHRLSQIRELSSEATAGQPPLQTLLFLYLGYIPNSDGDLYFADLSLESNYEHRRRPRGPQLWEIRDIEMHNLAQFHEEIFHELQVNIYNKRIRMLRSRGLRDRERENVNLQHYYDLSTHSERQPILIHKTDANALVRAAMDVGCNPQSFLYQGSKGKGGLIFRVLGRKGLKASIARALGVLNDGDQQGLKDEMTSALEALEEDRQPGSWSRGLWSKLSTLEDEVMSKYSAEEHPSMLAISVLFALDKAFRRRITDLDSDTNRNQRNLTLDFTGNAIIFPGPEDTIFFDFANFFERPRANIDPEREVVPYSRIAMACLRSHIIMAMWSMCISADDLSELYTNLDSIVHVSSRTLLRRRHAGRNTGNLLYRLLEDSDESTDSSEEDLYDVPSDWDEEEGSEEGNSSSNSLSESSSEGSLANNNGANEEM